MFSLTIQLKDGASSPPALPILRPSQQRAMAYEQGRMGISAVPGAGKTFILETLIADIIINRGVAPERIGLFTYMRSSRANLTKRINRQLEAHGLTTRVEAFTLHSLSAKLLKTFSGKALGSGDLEILESYEQERLISRLAQGWLRTHPQFWESLVPQSEGRNWEADWSANVRNQIAGDFRNLCKSVIRTAKNYRLTHEQIDADPAGYLGWAVPIYRDYQSELRNKGLWDYDDLAVLAVDLLQRNPVVLAEVQNWYDYIFEDEAQDSSPLQEELLNLLAEQRGNLVRVGDPNQAIMSTFTTAEPRFFIDFCRNNPNVALDESSRSAPKILALANGLVEWCTHKHPVKDLRDSLIEQYIHVASSGPPNPEDSEAQISFRNSSGTEEQELELVANMVVESLRERPEHTLAVLVPTNEAGAKVVTSLLGRGIRAIDLLRTSPGQQMVMERFKKAVALLAAPASFDALQELVQELARDDEVDAAYVQLYLDWLKRVHPERVFSPSPLEELLLTPKEQQVRNLLMSVERQVGRWLAAQRNPWPDLLRLIVQQLFPEHSDRYLGNYLVEQLERVLGMNPTADWEQVYEELRILTDTTHTLHNLPSDILVSDATAGTVTVTTSHRAKGLEWDEVWLTGLTAYGFPVKLEERPPGRKFMEGISMEAEALAELAQFTRERGLRSNHDPTEWAFLEQGAERLRLLYVGITRAKKRLTFSYAKQGRFDKQQNPSALYEELKRFCVQGGRWEIS